MARGQPDYGAYQAKRVGATLADMGDLAVRLGSIVEYDRRGDIVALDDFENTVLKWTGFGPAGAAMVLDSTNVKSGSQSVMLTTGPLLGSNSQMRKSFVILGTLQVGIEISLCDLAVGHDFFFSIAYWDGTAGRRARVWYDNSLDSFYVEDGVIGNWTLIANVGVMRRTEHLFYPIKLVADFTTNLYKRFLYASTEHNLSTVVIPPFPLAGGEYFLVTIECVNDVAVSDDAWVDDFILTQNEP